MDRSHSKLMVLRSDTNGPRRKALTLLAMSLGFIVVQLDVTVVNVAVKRIGASLGGGVTGLQWVVNAYTIAFASMILTAGAMGDRFGARRVFMAGFAIFVAASLACALAPSLAILVGARALQGLGAAILVPCSLALLNHAYPGENERTHAIGIWAAGASVALAAGPLVGGVLIAAVGWRSIFFINLPLGLLGIWLTWQYVEETSRTTRAFDFAGQVIAIFALADMAAATIEAGAKGWTNPRVLCGFALFAMAVGAFIWIESKSRDPMLPLRFFSDRTFSSATLIGWLINVAYYGLIFVFSLYFQELRSYTPLRTGLAFLPMTAVVLAANLSAGTLVQRRGPRFPLVLGQAIFMAGCFSLLFMSRETAYIEMAVPLLAVGAGIGLTVPPMTSVLLGTVDKKHSGVASGVLNSSRQAGSVVGVALFGSLIAQRARFVHGVHASLLISGIAVLIGCNLAVLVRSRETHQEPKQGQEQKQEKQMSDRRRSA
jgi:MFS transporter, DHA2 family, methylenomycin A resistance protein